MTPQEAVKGMRVRKRHGTLIWTICNLKSGSSYGRALLITDDGRYTVEYLANVVPVGP